MRLWSCSTMAAEITTAAMNSGTNTVAKRAIQRMPAITRSDTQAGNDCPNGKIQHAGDGKHAFSEHGVLNAEPADHRNGNDAAQNS